MKVSFTSKVRHPFKWSIKFLSTPFSHLDLSFVDYDKFNQYEAKIDKMLNRLLKSSTQDHVNNDNVTRNKNVDAGAGVVVRRRPKKILSNILGTDINKNLDREKNVYRQSIDSHKLKLLSSINLDSHRWSQVVVSSDPMEWLSLENKATNMAPLLPMSMTGVTLL